MAQFGTRGASYTPFVTQAMGGLSQAITTDRRNKLARAAWMGDPMAVQELAAVDPEMAGRVEAQATKRKDMEAQRGFDADARFQKDLERVTQQIAAFPNYASARAFGERATARMAEKYPERWQREGPAQFDEATFNEIKTIAGAGSEMERAGSLRIYDYTDPETGETYPADAQTFVDPENPTTMRTEWVLGDDDKPMRSVTGHDVERAGEKARETKREGTKEERLQVGIDTGLTAADGISDLKRAKELLTRVRTGGLAQNINMVRNYFGDQSVEVADFGEVQVLLANDLIEKFGLMTGVLSESDMRLLQGIAAGTTKPSTLNARLIDRLVTKAERKVRRGLDDAREGGRPSEVQELERAARALGLTEAEIEGGPGSSESNPVDAVSGEAKPPVGTWVRLPDGRVIQVK